MTDHTITISGPANLVAHIEGLQAAVTKRNARIAELEGALGRSGVSTLPTPEQLANAFERGKCAAVMELDAHLEPLRTALTSLSRSTYFGRRLNDNNRSELAALADQITLGRLVTVEEFPV